jgi:hypothetical protein
MAEKELYQLSPISLASAVEVEGAVRRGARDLAVEVQQHEALVEWDHGSPGVCICFFLPQVHRETIGWRP